MCIQYTVLPTGRKALKGHKVIHNLYEVAHARVQQSMMPPFSLNTMIKQAVQASASILNGNMTIS